MAIALSIEAAAAQHNAAVLKARKDAARKAADVAAAYDRTDPFVWGRVFTHMMNGIGEEHSYKA